MAEPSLAVVDTETGDFALDGALGRHLRDDEDALRALLRDVAASLSDPVSLLAR